MSEKPMVFVVDDDDLARDSICALVSAMDYPTKSFASAEDFLAYYQEDRPGCLVCDMRMRGMSGLELIEALVQRGLHMPVVMVTAYARTSTTVRAIKSGAVTLLDKPYADNDLWDAIRMALDQGTEEWDRRQRLAIIRQRLASLTDEQRQVLDLLVAGKANKSIAHSLGIGLRTVESRRHEVLATFRVDSLAELVHVVVEARLSPP